MTPQTIPAAATESVRVLADGILAAAGIPPVDRTRMKRDAAGNPVLDCGLSVRLRVASFEYPLEWEVSSPTGLRAMCAVLVAGGLGEAEILDITSLERSSPQ
jgi:hypothetical protein